MQLWNSVNAKCVLAHSANGSQPGDRGKFVFTNNEMPPLDGSIGEDSPEYLGYLLTQVQNRRVRAFAPYLETLGLSTAHWRALSTINRLEGCLMSELAEFTTVDRTTLTRTVDQLLSMGLVERRASAEDRRLVKVLLTDRGCEVFARALDGQVQQNSLILAGLSATEQRRMRALLQRLLRNILQDDALLPAIVRFRRDDLGQLPASL
jgi:DNA-binding MarR family transcriptional regulator